MLVLTLMPFGPLLLGRDPGRHLGIDGYTVQAYRRLMLPMLELFTMGCSSTRNLMAALRAATGDTGNSWDNGAQPSRFPPNAPTTPQDG